MAFTVTDANYEELLASDKPVMIDFWAEWCGPCRMVGPVMDEMATEYEGRAIIAKCDVDSCSEITSKFAIRNIPTVLYFKGGQLVDKQVGATSKAAFSDKLNKLL